MRTEVIETVMTREYWERNYRREYRRELRESMVDTCKGIAGFIIGTLITYKILELLVYIIEAIFNINFM